MILVTGATGTLGKPTVDLLRAAGYSVRSLSRHPAHNSETVVADLSTGIGLQDALAGVTTVVHLASGANARDSQQTRILLDALAAHPVEHLIFMSIVGVDKHSLAYYRDKFLSEHLIAASGIPYTILRATQFHSFVSRLFSAQRWSPVTVVPAFTMQPVAVEEVAERLTALVAAGPSQRVADFAGPEQLSFTALAQQWNSAHSFRRPVWTVPMPGAVGRSFARGDHLSTLPGDGRATFAEYAKAAAGPR
ncbi:SDR family oxidoreductase [Salinibacterium sp. M195]|uniref:SDR family oxidoreductase n=1 Tax=Salinibacterium sp. M195 TaxID=2583374 RepID=UPI001C62EFF9|nr:NAD(P)H-binding protein [Salinibacterium sp. M195]QYH35958.1 NAD-dependent epimerase/dehydratase family protein [Salinibacterium sp. M195]